MNILEKIFGSTVRIKIMRLFLFNPEASFEKIDIIKRAKISSSQAIKEINNLFGAGFIKRHSFFKEIKTKSGIKKKRVQGFYLNKSFAYLGQLKSLLLGKEPLKHNEIIEKINKSGKIKLMILSGVFIQEEESRADLLLVGDDINEKTLRNAISTLESEIGKELVYVLFSTNDYKYRLGMQDRLIRDIIEYPHQVVIDKIGI